MICVTQPFRLPALGDFFIGIAAATLLEYVTGVAMEALFQVRYWDYSNQRLNFQGHICLSSSLTWGVFTLILTRLIHPRVRMLLELIPHPVCFVLLTVLTVTFAADLAVSFHAAMDLRSMLKAITNLKNDADKLRDRFISLSGSLNETIQNKLGSFKGLETEKLEDFQASVSEYLEKLSALLPTEKFEDIGKLKERIFCLSELKKHIFQHMDFRKKRILKGNPMLTSPRYTAALKLLKEHTGRKEKK